jgi:hypothetical protein
MKPPSIREIEDWRVEHNLTVPQICGLLGIRAQRSWFFYRRGRNLPAAVIFKFLDLRDMLRA